MNTLKPAIALCALALLLGYTHAPTIAFQVANDTSATATNTSNSIPFTDAVNIANALTDTEADCDGDLTNGVWYRITPTTSQSMIADTIGSGFDTVLTRAVGTPGSLVELECSDPDSGDLSRIDFPAIQGNTYYFHAGGYQGETGSLKFNLRVASPPANDISSTATIIDTTEYTDTLSIADALTDTEADCDGDLGAGVWYRYTAGVNRLIYVDTLGSDFDTVLTVAAGTPGSLSEEECDDDTFGTLSALVLDGVDGVTYYFHVGGFGGIVGTLVVNLNIQALDPDIDGSGDVTPTDALFVINRIDQAVGSADINGDGLVTADDALIVIEALGSGLP